MNVKTVKTIHGTAKEVYWNLNLSSKIGTETKIENFMIPEVICTRTVANRKDYGSRTGTSYNNKLILEQHYLATIVFTVAIALCKLTIKSSRLASYH